MIGVAFVIGTIIGLIIPALIPFLRDNVVSSVEEMEDAVKKMDELEYPKINLTESVNSIRNAKAVLLSIESGEIDSANAMIIEKIGTFYYTWTHEYERELNDEAINRILKEIETDSNKSEGLKTALKFKPE